MRILMTVVILALSACAPQLNNIKKSDGFLIDGAAAPMAPEPKVALEDCSKFGESSQFIACMAKNGERTAQAKQKAAEAKLAELEQKKGDVEEPEDDEEGAIAFAGWQVEDTMMDQIVTPDSPAGVQTGFAFHSAYPGSTVRCFMRGGAVVPVTSRFRNASIREIVADLDGDGHADNQAYVCTTSTIVNVLGMEPGDAVDVFHLRVSTTKRLAGGAPLYMMLLHNQHRYKDYDAGKLVRRDARSAPRLK